MEIKIAEIYAFKMTSGQEMVATVESIDDEYYHIVNPLTIGQGPNGMEFMQAIFCAELLQESALLKTAVAIVSEARADVVEAYKASCEPEKKILTPNKTILHT